MSINPAGNWQRTGKGARFMLELDPGSTKFNARAYRYMTRVHALGHNHQRSRNNPIVLGAPIPVGTYGLAYRSALCGQIAYCCEDLIKPGMYGDQFGPVPFVSWRKSELVTCKSCQKALRK